MVRIVIKQKHSSEIFYSVLFVKMRLLHIRCTRQSCETWDNDHEALLEAVEHDSGLYLYRRFVQFKKKKKPLKIICFEKYMKINRKTKGKFTDGTRTGDSYGYDGLSFQSFFLCREVNQIIITLKCDHLLNRFSVAMYFFLKNYQVILCILKLFFLNCEIHHTHGVCI